ncbi:MAG: A24 family peptidase [Pseudomonadota bacterium]
MIPAALLTAALLLWAVAIAAVDWRQRRVPNAMLLLLLLPAIAVLSIRGEGLLQTTWPASLLGFAVALGVTLPGYWVSRLGAGDVKLAAVLGFVQGWPLVSYTLVAAGLLLGLGALVMVVMAGFADVRKVRVPSAWALLVGFAAVLLWQSGGWS